MEIDATVVIDLLRKRLSDATYELVLEQAKTLALEKRIAELESQIPA